MTEGPIDGVDGRTQLGAMLETVTLDQLRVLIAIADAGSFTAASRNLGRAQSAVSHAVAQAEANLGVALFDRTGRRPVATEAGRALLVDARSVVARMEEMRARARGYAQGLEAGVALALSPLMDAAATAMVLGEFRARFPSVALTIWTEPMGGAVVRVLERDCIVGVTGTLPTVRLPGALVARPICRVEQVAVAAPGHPLLSGPAPPTETALRSHVQIVLTDRSGMTAGQDIGIVSPETWRVTELATKRDLLVAGLGWGRLPETMAAAEIEAGRLARLPVTDGGAGYDIALAAIHRRDTPPGPSGRWLLDRLAAAGGGLAEFGAENGSLRVRSDGGGSDGGPTLAPS